MSAVALLAAWLGIGIVCVYILFGYRRWMMLLAAPIVFTLVVTPLIAPILKWFAATALANWWFIVPPAIVIAPIVLVILGLQLWVRILRTIFGSAGAHAGGIHIARFFDWLFARRRGRSMPRWEADEVSRQEHSRRYP